MTEYSKLDEEDFVKECIDGFKEARNATSTWRKEARMLYEFRAGKQWTDDELAYLEEQKRPPVTFNRAGTIIDAVVGAEVSNRQEVRYFPRTLGDSAVNEVATQTAKWVRDQCNAEDEESDAFEDVLISGMGWIETRLDYDQDPDGLIFVERIDPIEMYWTPGARKQNLEDADEIWREKLMDKDEVKAIWPEADEIVEADDLSSSDIKSRDADPPAYERDKFSDKPRKNQIRVVEYQWCEKAPFYRVVNPLTGKIESVDVKAHAKLKERFPDLKSIKQKKRKWYRAFVAGKTLLERGEAPIPEFSSFCCITGKRDRADDTWFGLMRGIKEPQEWANKFFSQILHIINSNSKGGFFWETGALKDPEAAKEMMARPEGMIELNPGKMSSIKERQMFQFPASIDRMLEFAISSIRDVPGVNLEMLGSANRDQAGVLEAQRTRQALGVLAPIFNNLRRYRKDQGRLLMKFITTYIADGRLVRIVGEEGAQAVPLLKDSMTFEYDIIVDQSPSSPNAKTEAWVSLSQVLPTLVQAGLPVPKEIVDIIPLPESIIGKWKEEIKKGPQIPEEVKQQMEQLQEQVQALSEENQQLKQNQEVKVADMQAKHAIGAETLQFEKEKAAQESELRIAELREELELKRFTAEAELELQKQKLEADIELKSIELEAEFTMKKKELEQTSELKRMEIANTADSDEAKSKMKDVGSASKQISEMSKVIAEFQKNSGKPKTFKIKRDAKGFLQEITSH